MKNLFKITTVTLLVILILMGTVTAASFVFSLKASTTTIEPSKEVEIEFNISDIDAGTSGINTVEAILEYDKTIFEEVQSTNFTSLNNWSTTYNSTTGKLLIVTIAEGVTENQSIGKLKLKVKSGATSTTTSVKFKNVQSNDGTDIIKETDKTVNFQIKSTTGTATPTPTSTPTPTPVANTTSPTSIPKTGIDIFYVILGIAILSFGSIFGYMAYRNIITK